MGPGVRALGYHEMGMEMKGDEMKRNEWICPDRWKEHSTSTQ